MILAIWETYKRMLFFSSTFFIERYIKIIKHLQSILSDTKAPSTKSKELLLIITFLIILLLWYMII